MKLFHSRKLRCQGKNKSRAKREKKEWEGGGGKCKTKPVFFAEIKLIRQSGGEALEGNGEKLLGKSLGHFFILKPGALCISTLLWCGPLFFSAASSVNSHFFFFFSSRRPFNVAAHCLYSRRVFEGAGSAFLVT